MGTQKGKDGFGEIQDSGRVLPLCYLGCWSGRLRRKAVWLTSVGSVALSTVSSPPLRWASVRAMKRPRPELVFSSLRATSGVQPRSKMWGR